MKLLVEVSNSLESTVFLSLKLYLKSLSRKIFFFSILDYKSSWLTSANSSSWDEWENKNNGCKKWNHMPFQYLLAHVLQKPLAIIFHLRIICKIHTYCWMNERMEGWWLPLLFMHVPLSALLKHILHTCLKKVEFYLFLIFPKQTANFSSIICHDFPRSCSQLECVDRSLVRIFSNPLYINVF